MTNKIGIYNHLTGENNVRDMTKEELADRNAEIAANLKTKSLLEAEAEANASAKSALLFKLGITEDEAKLLLS